MDFALSDEQAAIRDMARDFGRERIAPFALAWEAEGIPRDVLAEAGALGFAAMYVPEELGGAGLARLDAVLVFEALAEACPAVSRLHLDPQHVRLDDRALGQRGRPRPLPARASSRSSDTAPTA